MRASTRWIVDPTVTRTHGIFCPGHVSTPTRPSPHPRGFRLFTCQRAEFIPTPATPSGSHRQVRRRSPFQSPTGLVRGGGILSLIPPLSIGCPEDFRATFRRGRNDSQANDLRRKPSLSSECQKCCKSNKQPEPFDAAVQITTAGSRSSGRNQPNQLCSGRSYHPDQPCQAARILSLPGLDAPGCANRSITAGRQAGSVRGAIVPKGSPTTPGQALRRPGSRRADSPGIRIRVGRRCP